MFTVKCELSDSWWRSYWNLNWCCQFFFYRQYWVIRLFHCGAQCQVIKDVISQCVTCIIDIIVIIVIYFAAEKLCITVKPMQQHQYFAHQVCIQFCGTWLLPFEIFSLAEITIIQIYVQFKVFMAILSYLLWIPNNVENLLHSG